MEVGDFVVRKSYGKDITFKIIGVKENQDGKEIYILKGVNLRIEADSPSEDLEIVSNHYQGKMDRVFNENATRCIKKILREREKDYQVYSDILKKSKILRKNKNYKNTINQDFDEKMFFGRPGKVLHIDGDKEYLEVCLKTYKELSIDVVGKAIPENKQPEMVVDLVKEYRPDIVVLTGHDGIIRNTKNYMDINNYRNSKYFVESVVKLRQYEPDYDDLVIFAGACQSCYEAILDAGANFASSPNRVLIHCLDPVFVCEKIAYTNIDKVVSIKDVIFNTITGTKGIGGMQTRGKYREGFPKSLYIK